MEVNCIKTNKKDNQATKARAAVDDGSFNDLQNKIRSKVNEGISPQEMTREWPIDIIPDIPIVTGITITENYEENKFYQRTFTINQTGEIELGEPEEVRQQTNYIPISQKENAGFVFKDEKKRLVTGPVAIPGCKDCDFKRGEKILTVEEIADMVHAYNTEFRLVDKMHLFGETGEIDGEAVENWTLKEDLKATNIQGKGVTLPTGTWMATTKITSDEAWEKVEDGTYQGYSGTYISRKDADNLKALLDSANKSDFESELKAAVKRTLIADLEDPVPVTISLVPKPCVHDAIFTSIKDHPQADKAGRRFSNATTEKLRKGADSFKKAYDSLIGLLNDALAERESNNDNNASKQDLEVLNMNEDELNKLVEKKVKEARKEDQDKIKSLEEEVKSLKEGDGGDPDPDDKGAADKGNPDNDEDGEPEVPEEVKKELDNLKDENKALKGQLEIVNKKLGIDPDDGSLDGSDDDKKEPVYKGRTDRDSFGRRIK